mgnify:CR=1 FL=1
MSKKRLNRSLGGNIAVSLMLFIMGLFTALPIYFSIINAFKPLSELYLFPPRFIVYNPTINNFVDIISLQSQATVPTERYIFNTVFVSIATTALYVVLASMAAYPLAKHEFPMKNVIHKLIVFAILFSTQVTALPQYILMAKTGIINTYMALIFPALGGSFGVFLVMQFIGSFPNDVIEAARIDGCGELGIFFKIVFPSVKPAWVTLAILTFISQWNATGSQFIFDESLKTLPTMMSQLTSAGIDRAGVSAAISVILMLPPMISFIFSQSKVVETMAYSGIKE